MDGDRRLGQALDFASGVGSLSQPLEQLFGLELEHTTQPWRERINLFKLERHRGGSQTPCPVLGLLH